jgi:hypothetical protein
VHDGTRWSVPGDGVTGGSPYVLAPYRDGVVVAGGFTMSGERRITHAGVWSEAGWQTFGQGVSYSEYADGNVFALDVTDGRLTAGGVFDQAGPVRVGSVAEWRDDAWHDMAGGLGQVIVLPKVAGMLRVGGDIYVTGAFATAGGAAARNIARWDGETWSALGSGLNGPGYALVEHGGKVYVGGTFSTAGETAGNGVAAWDAATQAWSPLGNAPGFDHDVLSLAVVGDRYLVVGGHFHTLRAGMQDVARDLYGLVVFDTQAEIDPADPRPAGCACGASSRRSARAGSARCSRSARISTSAGRSTRRVSSPGSIPASRRRTSPSGISARRTDAGRRPAAPTSRSRPSPRWTGARSCSAAGSARQARSQPPASWSTIPPPRHGPPTARASAPASVASAVWRRSRSMPTTASGWAARSTRRAARRAAASACGGARSAVRADAGSANGLDRHLEELDGRAPLGFARAHRVERLVPAAHGLLGLEERDAESPAALAVHEHQHLRALETLGRLVGVDLVTDHGDRSVDVGGVALEGCYAREHRRLLDRSWLGRAYANTSRGCHRPRKLDSCP